MKTEHLRAVIVKVTQGDNVVISQAFGESMNGVPATTAVHFRNGAVAFAYLGTLLMKFVDEHKVTLDGSELGDVMHVVADPAQLSNQRE